MRPDGPKEGILVAWGFALDGERVLLDFCLGQRERVEDWIDLDQGLIVGFRRAITPDRLL